MRTLKEITVLVVDDDPDVTTFLGTILEDAGMDVVTAHDGFAALERIREKIPDLISLDLVMPGKSGIRLLHELRKHGEWSRIPVLIVTGHARDETIKRDLADVLSESSISGPSLYLEKPVTPEKYLVHVCRTLGIEPPTEALAPVAERDESLRREAESLLRDADAEELETVLDMLRARRARKTAGTGAEKE
jgi:CheY-like chemotaxis protein